MDLEPVETREVPNPNSDSVVAIPVFSLEQIRRAVQLCDEQKLKTTPAAARIIDELARWNYGWTSDKNGLVWLAQCPYAGLCPKNPHSRYSYLLGVAARHADPYAEFCITDGMGNRR
jgi:hypothetical protein